MLTQRMLPLAAVPDYSGSLNRTALSLTMSRVTPIRAPAYVGAANSCRDPCLGSNILEGGHPGASPPGEAQLHMYCARRKTPTAGNILQLGSLEAGNGPDGPLQEGEALITNMHTELRARMPLQGFVIRARTHTCKSCYHESNTPYHTPLCCD